MRAGVACGGRGTHRIVRWKPDRNAKPAKKRMSPMAMSLRSKKRSTPGIHSSCGTISPPAAAGIQVAFNVQLFCTEKRAEPHEAYPEKQEDRAYFAIVAHFQHVEQGGAAAFVGTRGGRKSICG